MLPFTSDYLSTYLSLCPSPNDTVLSFGPMDIMLAPASQYVPNSLYTLVPHPAQEPNEKRRYVAVLMNRYDRDVIFLEEWGELIDMI